MTNHRFTTRIGAALAALCAVLAVTACGAPKPDASGLDKVTFMLSWAPDTNHIGVYVAKHKGYYREAGLDVDIVAVTQSGAEQAVNNGVADFALSNLTNVSTYATKGAQLKQVMQVQQKTSAIWCALASNDAITRPKDFDGKVFATFGSNESDAVVRRMIETDGGTGDFDKVTVGTSTFATLSSGRADFGSFYSTWEGVQAKMNGPELRCFSEPDYGVPGNADSIGIITSDRLISSDPDLVKRFVQATQRGYIDAYEDGDEAAGILVHDAPEANLDEAFVKESMKTIIDGQYWGDRKASRTAPPHWARSTTTARSSTSISSPNRTPTPTRPARPCTPRRNRTTSPPTNSSPAARTETPRQPQPNVGSDQTMTTAPHLVLSMDTGIDDALALAYLVAAGCASTASAPPTAMSCNSRPNATRACCSTCSGAPTYRWPRAPASVMGEVFRGRRRLCALPRQRRIGRSAGGGSRKSSPIPCAGHSARQRGGLHRQWHRRIDRDAHRGTRAAGAHGLRRRLSGRRSPLHIAGDARLLRAHRHRSS